MSALTSNQNPSKRRIIKNVFILSAGVLLLFTAYDGLAMLQSTMNREQGIGVASQAIVYAGFCVSSLILPNYVIKKWGSKMTYTVSMLTYIPYIASNFYPHWILMIPASVLVGLGASLLWVSQATYLNDVSILYSQLQPDVQTKRRQSLSSDLVECAHEGPVVGTYHSFDTKPASSVVLDQSWSSGDVSLKIHQAQTSGDVPTLSSKMHAQSSDVPNVSSKIHAEPNGISRETRRRNASSSKKTGAPEASEDVESTTARFFGFHGMCYLTSHLWSNLMSYYVLQRNVAGSRNGTVSCVCGADYCNVESACFENNIEQPSDRVRYILTGVCVGLGLFAALLVAVFLDPIEKNKREDVKVSFEQLLATYKIATRKEVLLLFPASFFIGMAQGFYAGDFNKAFIGCAWGTHHVNLVAICYGVVSALSSTCSGWLVKAVGRVPIFSTAILVDLGAIVLMLVWKPSAEDTAPFFVAAALWGVYVGVFLSHLRAFYGILIKDNEEAAFASFHVWYSLGFCVSFSYSEYLCTSVKLYILLIVCIVGYLGYLFVERLHSKQRNVVSKN